jgi:hypothetical protein
MPLRRRPLSFPPADHTQRPLPRIPPQAGDFGWLGRGSHAKVALPQSATSTAVFLS